MPGFGIGDCDEEELRRASDEITKVGRFGTEVPREDEEMLRRLYLLKNGQFTNATVALFAREPRVWAPNLGVRVVSYASKQQRNSVGNDTTVEGPSIRVMKEVVGIVQQRTGFSGELERGKLERLSRPAYAVFALREGLVNAMVHRDYELAGGSVQVEIFPNEVVIRNPGHLPQGWTTAHSRGDTILCQRIPISLVFFIQQSKPLSMPSDFFCLDCGSVQSLGIYWPRAGRWLANQMIAVHLGASNSNEMREQR